MAVAVMNKCNIVSILNALIDKKRTKNDREVKDSVDDWAGVIFNKHRKPFVEEEAEKVVPRRRISETSEDDLKDNLQEVEIFLRKLDVSRFPCEFNIPKVRSRLEKLMGTNYVSLTDRDYMQKLQERILEDYEEQMEKRIKVREEEEMERVKNLVLVGKIPLEEAPLEMARHPIMLIEKHCNKLIAERRAKLKIYKVKIPTYLYWDDTPDPPSGLSIESGHVFRQQGEKLCHPVERHLVSSEEDDTEAGYMVPPEDYEKLKYEDSLVKRLLACETVEEMYALADDIIGVLKTIDESTKIPEDTISETLNVT